MHLTIIIPMYNEAGTIAVTMKRLRDTVMPDFVRQVEVIIVDDCSTDNSGKIAEQSCAGMPGARVIRLPVNSGKGAAVAAGVREAKGEIILIQDADLELDPSDIPALLSKMHSQNLDLVSGTRFADRKRHPGHASAAIMLNRLLSSFAARMTGSRITDLTCGYKLITKELFQKLNLRESGFGFETELMYRALNDSHIKFAEEPVSYSPRRKSEGKKIAITDGLGITAKVLRYGMAGKNWASTLALTLIIALMTTTMLSEKHWNDEKRVIEWDAISYYAYLPAAFIYHDLSLSFADNYQGKNKLLVWPDRGPQGKYVIKTTMGLSLLWTPFFLAGHAVAHLSGTDTGGYSPPYKFFLLLSALFFLTVGLIYLRKILLAHSSDTVTAFVLAAFVIGTNLFWYTLYQGTMSHVYSFALISAFVWYSMIWHGYNSIRPAPSIPSALRLGLLLGLITLIRPTNIIIVLFFILYGVTSGQSMRSRTRELALGYRYMAIMALAALIVWVPQMLYWKEITGQWLYFSYGSDERFFFDDPAIIKGLFSWRKGLFLYTPLMIFAFAGIISLWIRRSPHALAMTLFVPLNIYIIFSWWCWWYGGGLGQRAFIDSYALMGVAAASLLAHAMAAGKNWLKSAVLAAFILLASLGVIQNIQYYNGAIHWDSMTREAYLDSFGRLKPSARFHDLLEAPDYEKAREGLNR
ncbi:MAG TPA: glycosyltransferase family 2 protein [Bacteroidales bacterium]|nr:glycosyltransferase family 2 protein [Bacteroidales bacterium]